MRVDSHLLPKSRNTESGTKIQNSAQISFSYCARFKNPWSFASPHYKWGRR